MTPEDPPPVLPVPPPEWADFIAAVVLNRPGPGYPARPYHSAAAAGFKARYLARAAQHSAECDGSSCFCRPARTGQCTPACPDPTHAWQAILAGLTADQARQVLDTIAEHPECWEALSEGVDQELSESGPYAPRARP